VVPVVVVTVPAQRSGVVDTSPSTTVSTERIFFRSSFGNGES